MVFAVSTLDSTQFAWGISLGSIHWATHAVALDRQQSPIAKRSTEGHVPAAVLLNRTAGEPIKLDYWSPPHPRGTATPWPPEAVVSRQSGSGRFPVAAAWTGRNTDDNKAWPWKIDGEAHELTSLDAIACGVSQLTKLHANNAPSAIVIPNDFRQREQQKLLDACSALGVNASLLWLPVAAALAWLEDNSSGLRPPQSLSEDPMRLPVVHADWGQIRCSIVQLVPWQDNAGCRWIPARNRPMVSDWVCPGFGWNEAASCSAQGLQIAWNRLFGSSVQLKTMEVANSESNVLKEVAKWSVDQATKRKVDELLAEHLASISLPISILFVGDFAAMVSQGNNVHRQAILGNLQRTNPRTYDGVHGERFLARGSAVFARDRTEGTVSYLDTLPELELFIDRNYQYDWLRLLGEKDHGNQKDQFVEGGQEWELQKPIEGLALRRGATSLKLVVAHEEYPGVRELQVALDRPAELDLAAKLHVSATPAQGNAKLRLLTAPYGNVPAREIFANWNRMTPLLDADNRPIGKEEYAKSRPRAFPNLRPRPADFSRWRAFHVPAKRILDGIHGPDGFNPKSSPLGRLLDAARVASGTSAISSDGHVPPGQDQSTVDELTRVLFHYVSKSHNAVQHRTRDEAIKLLGFMSANCDGLDTWINRQLTQSIQTNEPISIISGNCIRDPKTASIFVRQLLAGIPRGLRQRLLNYQMQALGRLLSQRHDAMSELSRRDATLLVEECIKVFQDEIEKDKLAWLFEHSGLVVVYALRFRIYDQDFLEPNSDLALRAKRLFQVAIDKLIERRDRPRRYGHGGTYVSPDRARRLLAALQQLIDYIDKRGEGDILIALDD